MLMHFDDRVRLPNHEWTVAPRHQLTSGKKDFWRSSTQVKIFDRTARDDTTQVKPIAFITVDGGSNENPRFPKTLAAAIRKFREYNLSMHSEVDRSIEERVWMFKLHPQSSNKNYWYPSSPSSSRSFPTNDLRLCPIPPSASFQYSC